jgi:hypothetical protein
MCQETPRMQDFAPFTVQLLGAFAAHSLNVSASLRLPFSTYFLFNILHHTF